MNNIVNRRRVYDKVESIILPEGYRLGKYFNVTENVRIVRSVNVPFYYEMLVEPVISSGFKCLAGNNGGMCIGFDGKKAGISAGGRSTVNMITADTKHLVECKMMSSGSTFYIDGNNTGITANFGFNKIYFLGYNGTYSWFRGKCYYIKVYNSNKELIAYYVPCVDANNNPKMYNVVSSSFKDIDSGVLHVV